MTRCNEAKRVSKLWMNEEHMKRGSEEEGGVLILLPTTNYLRVP